MNSDESKTGVYYYYSKVMLSKIKGKFSDAWHFSSTGGAELPTMYLHVVEGEQFQFRALYSLFIS